MRILKKKKKKRERDPPRRFIVLFAPKKFARSFLLQKVKPSLDRKMIRLLTFGKRIFATTTFSPKKVGECRRVTHLPPK